MHIPGGTGVWGAAGGSAPFLGGLGGLLSARMAALSSYRTLSSADNLCHSRPHSLLISPKLLLGFASFTCARISLANRMNPLAERFFFGAFGVDTTEVLSGCSSSASLSSAVVVSSSSSTSGCRSGDGSFRGVIGFLKKYISSSITLLDTEYFFKAFIFLICCSCSLYWDSQT